MLQIFQKTKFILGFHHNHYIYLFHSNQFFIFFFFSRSSEHLSHLSPKPLLSTMFTMSLHSPVIFISLLITSNYLFFVIFFPGCSIHRYLHTYCLCRFISLMTCKNHCNLTYLIFSLLQ